MSWSSVAVSRPEADTLSATAVERCIGFDVRSRLDRGVSSTTTSQQKERRGDKNKAFHDVGFRDAAARCAARAWIPTDGTGIARRRIAVLGEAATISVTEQRLQSRTGRMQTVLPVRGEDDRRGQPRRRAATTPWA